MQIFILQKCQDTFLTVRGPTQEIPQEGPEYEGCLEEAKTNQLVPLGNET